MWGHKIWRRRLLVLSRGLMSYKMFREQIWSPRSRLRKFSLVTFPKVSGMPLILVYRPILKTIVSVGLKRGSVVHCQSCFLIPIGAKVDLDTKTLILQEIWHKSVRMVCHEGWWDWGQSDRRPAPRGIFCAHIGQECPNGFLSFVLNWNLSGVRIVYGCSLV